MTKLSKKLFFIVVALVVAMLPIAGHAAASSGHETASQKTLRRVMEAIRHCDKSEVYEYDPKTKRISPSWLKKIKGLRLVRDMYGMAVFRVDETYGQMQARYLVMAVSGSGNEGYFSVAFDGGYQSVRRRIEELWGVQFNEVNPPDMPAFDENQYGTFELMVNGKRHWVAVGIPVDFPPITIPEVGCSGWEN